MSRNSKILIAIMALAGILRLWGLGSAELLFDESFYSFRSIGWLDYLESPYQTTPVQWFIPSEVEGLMDGESNRTMSGTNMPWWLKLSFHDHPPLFFLIQKVFFNLFGDSLFISRLPSAIFGLGFVYLIYLIGKKLFKKESAGLISAFIAAISFAHISLSRLAMLESVLFFFILLNIYYFLKLLEMDSASSPQAKKYWWQFGLTFGMAMLTKYIAVFLIPTYLVFLVIKKVQPSWKVEPSRISWRSICLAIVLAIIIFSPVIVYNIYSYKTFGHFDLQLAYLLKQDTPWPIEAFGGKTQDPFSKIGENLPAVFSMPFLVIVLISLVFATIKQRKELSLVLISFVFIILLLTQTGSAIRFVSLLVIPAIFFITAFILFLWQKPYRFLSVGLIFTAIICSELYFFAFSKPDYGVVKLDKYFDSVFNGNRPENLPTHLNPYLNKVIQDYSQKYPATLAPTGIIYDDNIALQAQLWLFSRRQYYHGIPVMTASNFENIIEKNGVSAFKDFTLYFVKAEEASPLKPTISTEYAKNIEALLQKNNQKPVITITGYGTNAIPAFKVYKFSLN
ncbi:MAG: glycosyltransferase family 39 protein [bacterium]|nr:glycosyltransferase family 39 protein [bacterium]